MNVDAYVKTELNVIAVALVAIAINRWGDRVALPAAQAKTASNTLATETRDGRAHGVTFEQIARRMSAVEDAQKQQAPRIEALRSALQSTVMNATRRSDFPDGD